MNDNFRGCVINVAPQFRLVVGWCGSITLTSGIQSQYIAVRDQTPSMDEGSTHELNNRQYSLDMRENNNQVILTSIRSLFHNNSQTQYYPIRSKYHDVSFVDANRDPGELKCVTGVWHRPKERLSQLWALPNLDLWFCLSIIRYVVRTTRVLIWISAWETCSNKLSKRRNLISVLCQICNWRS